MVEIRSDNEAGIKPRPPPVGYADSPASGGRVMLVFLWMLERWFYSEVVSGAVISRTSDLSGSMMFTDPMTVA